jgi:anti-sigma regulatory factor (Ser/Thr protein kinase)
VIIGGWRGPGWRVMDADPGQARQVRDWIRSAVTRHDGPADPSDAALAVSELYANAVMHGPAGGRVLAGYCLWSAGARIVVCDGGGPGTPRLRQDPGLAEGGRGLAVIDSVAARWGSFRLSGAQVVWCDFGQPLRAPESDAWAWLQRVLSAGALTAPAPEQDPVCAPGWFARAAAR